MINTMTRSAFLTDRAVSRAHVAGAAGVANAAARHEAVATAMCIAATPVFAQGTSPAYLKDQESGLPRGVTDIG